MKRKILRIEVMSNGVRRTVKTDITDIIPGTSGISYEGYQMNENPLRRNFSIDTRWEHNKYNKKRYEVAVIEEEIGLMIALDLREVDAPENDFHMPKKKA